GEIDMQHQPAQGLEKSTQSHDSHHDGCAAPVLHDHARHGHEHHHNAHHSVHTGRELQQPALPGAEYTCPMHPEVRQIGPGNCPICGMALEPVAVTLDEQENHELIDFTRRFWVGLALTLPLFVLEMGSHIFDLHRFIAPPTSDWLQL